MLINPAALADYLQIIVINLVLSGDNVVVIGMAAAALDPGTRRTAIVLGIAAATVIRIGFAAIATQLLAITGLLLAGGLLLLWVCWKMYSELRGTSESVAPESQVLPRSGALPGPRKTLRQAVTQIVIADVSMSLDNVLAVAGAARQNMAALVFGLTLSVVLMGVAASLVARLLHRHRWIGWIGLLIITYVAVRMIYGGLEQVLDGRLPELPLVSV